MTPGLGLGGRTTNTWKWTMQLRGDMIGTDRFRIQKEILTSQRVLLSMETS